MKTEALVARNWDDVVFENRHRDYGAYDIRQSYSRSVIAGWGVSVSLACMLIVVPKIAAMFGHDVAPPKTGPIIVEGTFPLPPPPIKKIDPPVTSPPAQKPPRREITAANIQVTNQNTETQVVENSQVVNPSTVAGDGPPAEYTGPAVVEPPAEPAPPAPPTIFLTAEVMPKFDGMVEFLSRKLRYPSSARRLGIEGKVYVGFVVDFEGKVTEVKVVRGIHPDCDKEAVRVVSLMPPWTPGKQNNYPVSVRMVVPINFQMQH